MTEDTPLPEHVLENRAYWDGMADDWVTPGKRSWSLESPVWGCWSLAEAELGLLPEDMSGMRTIELGCGTGYVSGWMAGRGARVVGIDNSERQLQSARRLADQHGASLELHHGNAETLPFPDESFDFAISEYGAATWCDPRRWIPEAHRVLRAGSQLVFLGNSPLNAMCTTPDGTTCEPILHRSYFDLRSKDWRDIEQDPGGIEFNLPISGWLRLFRETGFEVLDYLELQVPPGSPTKFGTPGTWAEQWPAEQVWKLERKA